MPEPPRIRTLAEAAAWLEGLFDVEKRPRVPYARLGLDAIRALLDRLGDPHGGLPVVHIAGSKGKGSTALLCEAVLGAGGCRVGTFTSPHLLSWTERFRIGGREVAGERLAAALERIRPEVEALREGGGPVPTFFDATTAAALLLFREEKVDAAVLEVGLGGRLDSTNVVRPLVTCITSIELEHTEKLGDTRAAIAAEKAGILEAGVPLVAGALSPEARAVVEERARALGCPVAWLGGEIAGRVRERGPDGLGIEIEDGPHRIAVRLPLLGAHQAGNAALAFACARRAGLLSDAELARAAQLGLPRVALPGRAELLPGEPRVLVDAAHTGASARALAAVLRELPRRRTHLVLSISADKDVAAILAALLPEVDAVTATRADPARSLAPRQVADAVRAAGPTLPLRVVPNPHLALRAARESLAAGDLLVATGSIYLAGIARGALADPPVAGE